MFLISPRTSSKLGLVPTFCEIDPWTHLVQMHTRKNLWKFWLNVSSKLQGNIERINKILHKFVCFQMLSNQWDQTEAAKVVRSPFLVMMKWTIEPLHIQGTRQRWLPYSFTHRVFGKKYYVSYVHISILYPIKKNK